MLEQPACGEAPLVYVGLARGKVVAMRGFSGAEWEVTGTGERFCTPCGSMFVTDPEVRGQGLGKFVMHSTLEDLATCGFQYVLSFGAGPLTFAMQAREGWMPVQSYGVISRYTGRLGLRRSLGRQFPFLRQIAQWARSRSRFRAPPQTVPPLPAFDALDGDASAEWLGGELRVARAPDPASLAGIADATNVPGRFRHVRSPAYLEWRYRLPAAEYRFVDWSRGDSRGILALLDESRAGRPIEIVDWEATVCRAAAHEATTQGVQ